MSCEVKICTTITTIVLSIVLTYTEPTKRFLSCIRIGEYEGALENLHRFFDYCLLNREIPLYQYALLNLAILEHTFGHKQKALAVSKASLLSYLSYLARFGIYICVYDHLIICLLHRPSQRHWMLRVKTTMKIV